MVNLSIAKLFIFLLSCRIISGNIWDLEQKCYRNKDGTCLTCAGSDHMLIGLKLENGQLVQHVLGCKTFKETLKWNGWVTEGTRMYKYTCPNPSHFWTYIKKSRIYGCSPTCPEEAQKSQSLGPELEDQTITTCELKTNAEFWAAWGNRTFLDHSMPSYLIGELGIYWTKVNKMGVDDEGIFYIQEAINKPLFEDGFYTIHKYYPDTINLKTRVAEHPLSCEYLAAEPQFVTYMENEKGEIVQGECIKGTQLHPSDALCPGVTQILSLGEKEVRTCRLTAALARAWVGEHEKFSFSLNDLYGPAFCDKNANRQHSRTYGRSAEYKGFSDYLYSCHLMPPHKEDRVCIYKDINWIDCYFLDSKLALNTFRIIEQTKKIRFISNIYAPLGTCPPGHLVQHINNSTGRKYEICQLTREQADEIIVDPVRKCILESNELNYICIDCGFKFNRAIYAKSSIDGKLTENPIFVKCADNSTSPKEYLMRLKEFKTPHSFIYAYMNCPNGMTMIQIPSSTTNVKEEYVCMLAKCPESHSKTIIHSTEPNMGGTVCVVNNEIYSQLSSSNIRSHKAPALPSPYIYQKHCSARIRELQENTKDCVKCESKYTCGEYSVKNKVLINSGGYLTEIVDKCIKESECKGEEDVLVFPKGGDGLISPICYRKGICPTPNSIWTKTKDGIMCSRSCKGSKRVEVIEGVGVTICEQSEELVLESWGKVKGDNCLWDPIHLQCKECKGKFIYKLMKISNTNSSLLYFGDCVENNIEYIRSGTHYRRSDGNIYPIESCNSETFGREQYLTWVKEEPNIKECLPKSKCYIEETDSLIINKKRINTCELTTYPRGTEGKGCEHELFNPCTSCLPNSGPYRIYENGVFADCVNTLNQSEIEHINCAYILTVEEHPQLGEEVITLHKEYKCSLIRGFHIVRIVSSKGEFLQNMRYLGHEKCEGVEKYVSGIGEHLAFKVCEVILGEHDLTRYSGRISSTERNCLVGSMPLVKGETIIDCVEECIGESLQMHLTAWGETCFFDTCLSDIPTRRVALTNDPRDYIPNDTNEDTLCITDPCFN